MNSDRECAVLTSCSSEAWHSQGSEAHDSAGNSDKAGGVEVQTVCIQTQHAQPLIGSSGLPE